MLSIAEWDRASQTEKGCGLGRRIVKAFESMAMKIFTLHRLETVGFWPVLAVPSDVAGEMQRAKKRGGWDSPASGNTPGGAGIG
jgi:hypothetical protein